MLMSRIMNEDARLVMSRDKKNVIRWPGVETANIRCLMNSSCIRSYHTQKIVNRGEKRMSEPPRRKVEERRREEQAPNIIRGLWGACDRFSWKFSFTFVLLFLYRGEIEVVQQMLEDGVDINSR